MSETRRVRNYVDGQFVEPQCSGVMAVENPSSGLPVAQLPLSTADEVDRAVQAARRAFAGWSQTPASRRVEPLYRLAALMRQHEQALAQTIALEMGKSLVDARAELKRAVENVEVACGMPVLQQGQILVGASVEIDGEVLRLPRGVFGVIAPFNFPAMVPFWFIPTAIATGNTVVVKASELVPCTMEQIAELCDQAGLPPGVLNVVNGDRGAGEALVEHPDVEGISFVGSTAVGRTVARRCAELGKRFQVMGSAKNHLVVLPDANLEETVRNMVTSCFGCAGQRCMAASAIVTVGAETHARVTEAFLRAAREVPVGDPLDPAIAEHPQLMGPVITAAAKERIHNLIARGVQEGATLALDGRQVAAQGPAGGHYVGPTVLTGVEPGSTVHREEIFGPVVVMLQAADFDQALALVNSHAFGNGASVYTQSGYWARRFKLEAQAGMIGINIGIPAPVAQLPFGGMKDSLLSDIKAQGVDGIDFFTERKVITVRYPRLDG